MGKRKKGRITDDEVTGVARGLSCRCQGSVEGENLRHPTKQIIQVKKSFQPAVVLDFVLRMAICTWVEDGEEVRLTKRATQVIAFRRHSYIKKDWIYQETMRQSESCSACDDSEVPISSYSQMQCWSSFDDDTMPSVAEESDLSKDQETNHEVFPQKRLMNMTNFSALDSDEELESMCENQAICRVNMVDSTALGFDNEFETLCEDQIICTINMVDFSAIDSDENQVEDVDMFSSMDDDFVSVEEGFEVQNLAGVCARGPMNVEEMKKGRSGTEFCPDNGPTVSAFCCTNKEMKPSCSGNCHSDRLGLESFPARTVETIGPKEGSITGVCTEYKVDGYEKYLATLIPKKMDGKSASLDGRETILIRTEFVDCFDLNSGHDKTIYSDPLSKSCKIQPFAADASFQDAITEVETQLSNDYHPVEPPVRTWAEERAKQPLLEILTHLHCLALDPFYFSAGSTESECQSILNHFNFESIRSISVCQVILKYRCLIYHNICNFYPEKHICGHGQEFGKLHEIPQLDSSQQCSLATEMQTEFELLSHNHEDANKNPHACTGVTTEDSDENVEVNCLLGCMPEIHTIKPVSEEELPATEEFGKLHEIPQLDSSQQCNLATEMQTEVELFSHNQEDANKNPHACTGETTEGSGENVKVNCFLSYMPEIHTIEPVFKEELPAPEPMSKDPGRTHFSLWTGTTSEATGDSQLQPSCTDDHISVHSCKTDGATSKITSKSASLGTISKNSCHSKRQRGRPVSFDSSLELLSPHHIFPLSRRYASSTMDITVSNSDLLCQSSDGHSEVPTSLHMKFPKNFNIPSKVELIKKFTPFGPVDYVRTRIFLYTGAAQVVFLHKLDAVAACIFSKRKNLFGQTNVLFWLDPHEHQRRKTNMPAQLSLSGVGTSALNLKSCLKASKSYGKSNKRKALSVKFVLEKNISSATTIAGKNTPFTDSETPFNVWENRRPDISQRMLMLLEECNQLVCQIKDGFGVQSYYKFTQTMGCEKKLLDCVFDSN